MNSSDLGYRSIRGSVARHLRFIGTLAITLAVGWGSIEARALAQEAEPAEPSFSVSSRQTFSPSGQPKVFVQFRQVDHLDFRVYRVNDPILFLANLRDAHSFGGEKAQLAREKTWLERFHEWKRDWRVRIRDFFRRQLQYATRFRYHEVRVHEQKLKRIPLDVAAYAQVPLLNRQQLVLGWRELLPRTRDSEYQEIPVDLHQKGLFLVEVAHQELRAYTLLIITDLALVSKTAPGQVFLYAADRHSGAPVSGSDAVIFNNHHELARGKTDDSGVFQTTFTNIKVEDSIMVAQAGQDVVATSVEPFFFFDSSATEYIGYIYTDRPVYRPTHEVNFKGIVRARRAGQYSLDVPSPLTVEVTDPNQKTVYQQKLELSRFGSFNGKLTLGPLAALGTYSITGHLGDKSIYGNFEVKEYKKPEFEVSVTADKARYLQGEPIQATISARYYFGAPVANGKVKYSVYRSRYFFPYWQILWGTEDYEGDEGGYYQDYFGEEISQDSGQLDADGVLHASIPTEINSQGQDYRYRIEAHVTDASNREIVGGRGIIATFSTILVLLQTDRYVYSPGDQADITVRTLDYDSHPVSAHVQLAFENRQDGYGRKSRGQVLSTADVTTDANGTAHYTYTVPSVPWLTVRASATYQTNRPATFESSLWVAGASWAGSELQYRRVDIYPDKQTYKPGDTAHVLIVTHEPGAQVLVTTEGQQVYTHTLHDVATDSFTVDIPIEERYEPNFFVGVTFLKNEQLFENSKNIAVPAAEKVLKVTVETDKPQYRPNDKVTYTLTTQDEQGRPVSAEVSLGVVDEAIYAVQPDTVQPPEKTFYAREWNKVFTQFSTTYWFVGYSGQQKMQLSFLRPPTRFADFKNPGQMVQPTVRKYFPDTMAWLPTVVTDAGGKAQATFSFPDSLTTWRATARAVTRDTLVGQITSKVITRKNLILRLETPRFLTQGDNAIVTAIVHNYLAQAKSAQVSLQVEGVELAGAAQSTVNVPQNGEATVAWTVRAPKLGQAKFTAKALTDEESDALELDTPVRPWGLQMNAAASGALRGDKEEATQAIVLPQDLNSDASSLRFDLTPSIAGTLMSALDFLSTYPYGCVEQTMSSFLPNILLTQATKELGLQAPPQNIELEKKIAAGLERLYQFQHDDGGWGWWETDQTHPFMTAYVVAGLAQAKQAGYTIDDARLERGRQSLLRQIQQNPRALADIRTYLVYALDLSGTVDGSLVEGLYSSRAKLSPHGVALMALLLGHRKDTRAAEFVRMLAESVQTQGPFAWWKSEREEMLDFSSDNSFETTAYAVKALADIDPKNDLLPKAARWLIDHRSDGYYWDSTEQTASAIFGLIDYLKVSGELKANYTFSVYLNGQKLAERQVSEKDVANPLPIVITANAPAVRAGGNEVRVVKSGPGVLYWSAAATYYSRQPKPAPAGTTALNVVREYFRLAPERQSDRIVYSEKPLDGPVEPGDVVEVRLTVTSTHDEQYFEIEDPIPAGFEFVEQEGLYELKEKPSWWDFYYTQREFHDDRAALFSTTFERGQGQFHYLLKAVTPGAFQATPARVLPMYEPSRQASTPAASVTIAAPKP
jgi:hypothetical protein